MIDAAPPLSAPESDAVKGSGKIEVVSILAVLMVDLRSVFINH